MPSPAAASAAALALCLASAGCASLPGVVAGQGASQLHEAAVRDLRDGEYERGAAKALEALELREQALGPGHLEVAASLQLLATFRRLQGRYAEAEQLYQRSLVLRENTLGPGDPRVAESLNHLGVLYEREGRHSESERLYRRALEIRETALGPEHPDVAQSLNNLGLLLQDAADYRGARPLLERALRIWERRLGSDHRDVGSALNNLALLLQSIGDHARARSLLERALRIWERMLGPEHPEVASGLTNLGLVLQETGDYAAARPLLERALQVRRKRLGPGHPDLAQSLGNLAVLLWFSGDHGSARTLLDQALATWERALGPDHPNVGTTLSNLARVVETHDPVTAARLYERAASLLETSLGARHPQVALVLHNRARLLYRSGDPEAARPLFERALEIREQSLGATHPLVGLSLTDLAALLLERGDHAAATASYERALRITRSRAPEVQWRSALGLGRAHERAGRLDDALSMYREAVKTLEGLAGQFADDERARYLDREDRLAAYDALARALLRLNHQHPGEGYDREAWAVLEARRGRIAAEALSAARPRLRGEAGEVLARQLELDAIDKTLREEQAKAPAEQRPDRMENLTALLARNKSEYLRVVGAFLAEHPRYKGKFVDQQRVDPALLAKFADRLPAGTLAVQYYATRDALYLFLVAPGGLFEVKTRSVTQDDLYALVREYRVRVELGATRFLPWADDGSAEHARDVLPLKRATEALSAHLLEPIEPELAEHASLIVMPNDLMFFLPIHALTRVQPGGSVRFLAETHAVSYLTRQELMDLLVPSASAPEVPLLAMGNPDGSLPGASREIRELRTVRRSVTALEGSAATKARFESLVREFPDLHLATHGVLDPDRPEDSYLLMAGEDPASRRLTIGEIEGLSLGHGIAILSACETALGEQVPGAALITLAAAFSQGGSRSIVASLWKVEDDATRDFMLEFHRALGRDGPAVALQRAQLALLANPGRAHPYYWAPFILVGAR